MFESWIRPSSPIPDDGTVSSRRKSVSEPLLVEHVGKKPSDGLVNDEEAGASRLDSGEFEEMLVSCRLLINTGVAVIESFVGRAGTQGT